MIKKCEYPKNQINQNLIHLLFNNKVILKFNSIRILCLKKRKFAEGKLNLYLNPKEMIKFYFLCARPIF